MRQEPPTFKGFITAFGGNWFTKMSVVQTGGHNGKDGVMRGESSNCEFWGPRQTDFRIADNDHFDKNQDGGERENMLVRSKLTAS